jgi:hypothetical protein
MAIHFLTNAAVVACGKTNVGEVSEKPDEVSCKNCLRSQAFTQREVTAQPAPAPVSQSSVAAAPQAAKEPAAKPALSVVVPAGSGKTSQAPKRAKVVTQSSKNIAFAEWRERFGEKDRLPRGKAFASM